MSLGEMMVALLVASWVTGLVLGAVSDIPRRGQGRWRRANRPKSKENHDR